MAAKDYYDTLGVSKKATADEIKKAFRKQARKHHPDAGGSEEKFKELNEAYEVLSDAEKRAQYDQFGQYFGGNMPPGGGQGAPGAGWPGGGGAQYQNVDLGDSAGSSATCSPEAAAVRADGRARTAEATCSTTSHSTSMPHSTASRPRST